MTKAKRTFHTSLLIYQAMRLKQHRSEVKWNFLLQRLYYHGPTVVQPVYWLLYSLSLCCIIISLSHCYLLYVVRSLLCSNLFYIFNLFFLCLFSCFVCFCFLFCVFCVFCTSVVFLLLYIAVSLLFVYNFTSICCHRAETQFQSINNTSHHITSDHIRSHHITSDHIRSHQIT
jgi:hypothetical protein